MLDKSAANINQRRELYNASVKQPPYEAGGTVYRCPPLRRGNLTPPRPHTPTPSRPASARPSRPAPFIAYNCTSAQATN